MNSKTTFLSICHLHRNPVPDCDLCSIGQWVNISPTILKSRQNQALLVIEKKLKKYTYNADCTKELDTFFNTYFLKYTHYGVRKLSALYIIVSLIYDEFNQPVYIGADVKGKKRDYIKYESFSNFSDSFQETLDELDFGLDWVLGGIYDK